jgi:hypothetical protein
MRRRVAGGRASIAAEDRVTNADGIKMKIDAPTESNGIDPLDKEVKLTLRAYIAGNKLIQGGRDSMTCFMYDLAYKHGC